jgi:pyruvate dehydrogenase E1 component alpha subunit
MSMGNIENVKDGRAWRVKLGNDYRNPAEREAWMKRDPVKMFRAYLAEKGIADAGVLDALEAEVAAEVEAAVQFAEDSDYPAPSVAFKDLYTEPFGVTQ